jgi:hypothetical protein
MEGQIGPPPQAPKLGQQTWELAVADIERDTDRDGWTDAEEQRLGIDPKKADSDGDGIPDGEDCCPNLAARQPADARGAILQRAVFACFGLSRSRHLLLVQQGTRPVHVWGYAGPVIYLDAELAKRWDRRKGRGIFVRWKITKLAEDTARVSVSDWEGPLAAGSQELELRKIGGEWFVVKRVLGPVS